MERFSFVSDPVSENVVYKDDCLRILLLTSCLLRLERGRFTDLST